jgi:hypothetical protein
VGSSACWAPGAVASTTSCIATASALSRADDGNLHLVVEGSAAARSLFASDDLVCWVRVAEIVAPEKRSSSFQRLWFRASVL